METILLDTTTALIDAQAMPVQKLEKENAELRAKLDKFTVSEDAVDNVADTLNAGFDSDDQYRYSTDQVRRALERFVEDHIEHWMIGLESEFEKLPDKQQERFLGEPNVDLYEAARWDRADYLYDRMMDK